MYRRIVSTLFVLPAIFTGIVASVALGAPANRAPQTPSVSAAQSPQGSQANLDQLVTEAQGWLADLIRIDTRVDTSDSSENPHPVPLGNAPLGNATAVNPAANQAFAAKYVAGVLQKENIPDEVFEMAPGHTVVVATLQSGPLRDPSKALLLVSHLDVVGVDKSKWSVDPFAGTVKDGYLWGRGALDDKGMLAANLATIVELKRAGVHLNRDVIFLADDGEQLDGPGSIKAVIEKYWDKIGCGFALTEGGRVVLQNGKVQYVGIQASEKVPYNVAVIATGSSGDASIPRPDNSAVHLAAAVEKIGSMETPVQLMTIVRRYFEQLAPIEDDDTAKWMRALETPERFQLSVRRLSDMSPVWGSLLRDSVVPTEMRAGARTNVVPSESRANISVSLLPDDSIGTVVAQMQKTVNDPQIRFEIQPDSGQSAPPSSLTSDLYQGLERAIPRQFPGAIAVPYLSAIATDSAELRLHNVQSYGLLPFPLTEADELRTHADDERIPLVSFHTGIEFLYRTVHDFVAN